METGTYARHRTLEIDGAYWDEGFSITEPVPGGKPQAILRLWCNNFHEGMPPGAGRRAAGMADFRVSARGRHG